MKGHYPCRVCGSLNTSNLGLLPQQTHFAGSLLKKRMPESSLFKCDDCMLLVRHPIMIRSQYNALYKLASSKIWQSSKDLLRQDRSVVNEMIVKRNKGNIRVLDVGCYTGELLLSLPESYEKYGVEMSEAAAFVAADKGIKIVGNDLYEIDTCQRFDVIIAVDVIEHTHNPELFIANLMSLLAPNGRLIISTGNTDNWLWRKLKNRFWYSKFPEHISFIGERWLDKFCHKNNYIVVDKAIFNYLYPSLRYSIKNFVKLILSILHIATESYSMCTEDHFCFSIINNIQYRSTK